MGQDRRTWTSRRRWTLLLFGILAKLDVNVSSLGLVTALQSPVESFRVRGHDFFVKRDDLLKLPPSGVDGNKARKLAWVNDIPQEAFPPYLSCFGGPQCNCLISLARIAHSKGSRLLYYTKPFPRWLEEQPVGNLAKALDLGCVEFRHVRRPDFVSLFQTEAGGAPSAAVAPEGLPNGTLWIPQGGSCPGAEAGVQDLAQEISDWWTARAQPKKALAVVLPAGTGTTGLFLARHLRHLDDVTVVLIPAVGDGEYTHTQMTVLDSFTGGFGKLPELLEPKAGSPAARPGPALKSRFGTPTARHWAIWKELQDAGLKFDLLYAPRAWDVLLHALEQPEPPPFLQGREILYVHTGGLESVSSQRLRYEHAGFS